MTFWDFASAHYIVTFLGFWVACSAVAHVARSFSNAIGDRWDGGSRG